MLLTDTSRNQAVTSPTHNQTWISDRTTPSMRSESVTLSSDTSANESTNVWIIYTAQITEIVSHLNATNTNTTQSSNDNGLTTTEQSFSTDTTNKDPTITVKASTIDETTSDLQTST